MTYYTCIFFPDFDKIFLAKCVRFRLEPKVYKSYKQSDKQAIFQEAH